MSTSKPRCAIGPESPRFIEIPQLTQAYAKPKKDIKGTLPPPRKIFLRRHGDKKISPAYLSATAPMSQSDRKHQAGRDAWRDRMADQRRENLREGLEELHARKVKRDAQTSGISAAKAKERYRLLHAPQPEHQRLTADSRSTVELQGLPKGPIPDPNRAERIALKTARVRAMAEAKADERKTALHELYMRARYFITSQKQLEDLVEHEFDAQTFARLNGKMNNQSLWDAYGPPETVAEKMIAYNTTQKGIMDNLGRRANLTGERMQRLAEELTGGKMDKRALG